MKMKNIENAPKPKGHAIPLSVRPSCTMKIGKQNVLLTGDAAGQVKSTTGGGVIFGGQCAALAGKYADHPMRYEIEWRLRHGPDLLTHKIIHSYLSAHSDDAMAGLGKLLNRINCGDYLSNHGHMDRPIKMIQPQIVTHVLKSIVGVI